MKGAMQFALHAPRLARTAPRCGRSYRAWNCGQAGFWPGGRASTAYPGSGSSPARSADIDDCLIIRTTGPLSYRCAFGNRPQCVWMGVRVAAGSGAGRSRTSGRQSGIVLRLLYSYRARGTAVKKSVWCCMRSASATGPCRVPRGGRG
jgi:hypothetical protein